MKIYFQALKINFHDVKIDFHVMKIVFGTRSSTFPNAYLSVWCFVVPEFLSCVSKEKGEVPKCEQ